MHIKAVEGVLFTCIEHSAMGTTITETSCLVCQNLTLTNRRRVELEDKTKVVASVWGAEFVQFLAALAVLPQSI